LNNKEQVVHTIDMARNLTIVTGQSLYALMTSLGETAFSELDIAMTIGISGKVLRDLYDGLTTLKQKLDDETPDE